MSPEKLGSVIGSVFGLVFVLVNTGSVPAPVGALLRVLAVAAFIAVLLAARRPGSSTSTVPAGGGFGRRYWLVVAAEVVAIFAGLALLNGPLDRPKAGVAWVTVVVGAHFLALAVVWRQALFTWLGGALLACGTAGLVLAAVSAPQAAVDLMGGVLPGAILLGFSLWGSRSPGAAAPRASLPADAV